MDGRKTRHEKTINIRSLSNNQEETDQNRLPEIFLNFTRDSSNQLILGLCDSGAQTSIIGHDQLCQLGFNDNQIQKTESYNIQSSTELVEDAIIGKIKLIQIF